MTTRASSHPQAFSLRLGFHPRFAATVTDGLQCQHHSLPQQFTGVDLFLSSTDLPGMRLFPREWLEPAHEKISPQNYFAEMLGDLRQSAKTSIFVGSLLVFRRSGLLRTANEKKISSRRPHAGPCPLGGLTAEDCLCGRHCGAFHMRNFALKLP